MPSHRQKATAASTETKQLAQEVPHRSGTNPTSYFYANTHTQPLARLPEDRRRKLRSAVIDGDPYDIAVDWQNYSFPPAPREHELTAGARAPPLTHRPISQTQATNRILVLNTASEKKAGGEWEGGVLGAEESLCRRSNLAQALVQVHPDWQRNTGRTTYYPLPHTGGIYSPDVVVFRSGHEKDYSFWRDKDWTVVSVASVACVRRPKVDESGMKYSFIEERELQREKMKTVLRIAANHGHVNLVLGGFGSCPPGTGDGNSPSPGGTGGAGSSGAGSGNGGYRNPIRDVCRLWRDLLFEDTEFEGYFSNVVFAIAGGNEIGGREFRRYFG